VELGPTFHLRGDEFGLRPIYYVHDEKYLWYADHIIPLLGVQGDYQPNPISIQNYLGRNSISEDTFFKGVKRLLPGQELICDSTGQVVANQYYRTHFSKLARSQTDIHFAAERMLELLLESVESSVGDEKDLGVSLSGGLDSSAIVACVSKLRQNARIRTFSVISDENHEDAKCSEMVANQFGAEHVIVRPNAEEFWSELRDFFRCQEAPVSTMDTYCDWKMHERAKDGGIKKLLGGTGADSLIMGVHSQSYLHPRSLDVVSFCSTLLEQREYMMLLTNLPGSYDIIINRLWRKVVSILKDPEGRARRHSTSRLGDIMSTDLECLYNNATYFGIEPESPFLYLPLAEYLMTLPLDCKIRNGYTKYVLREAMKPLLPERVVTRKSKGVFADPESQWFNGPLHDKLRDFFSGHSLKAKQYFDPNQVHDLLDKKMHKSECAYLWRILNLEIWFREFF
jgi:asparagine synthase (glutamine-hydrolysing)